MKMADTPDFSGCGGFWRWVLWRVGRALTRLGGRAEAAADPGTRLRRMLEEVRNEGSPSMLGDLIGRSLDLLLLLFWPFLTVFWPCSVTADQGGTPASSL